MDLIVLKRPDSVSFKVIELEYVKPSEHFTLAVCGVTSESIIDSRLKLYRDIANDYILTC